MGNFSFIDGITYVLKSVGKVPNVVLSGIANIVKNISNGISILSAKGTHSDMTNSGDKLFTAFSSNFWIGLVYTLVTLVLAVLSTILYSDSFLSGGIAVILTTIFGGIGTLVGVLFSLVIISIVIFLGKKYLNCWNLTLIKVLIVLGFLSMAGNAISAVTSLVSCISALFSDFVIISLLENIVSVIYAIVVIGASSCVIEGLVGGNVYTRGNVGNNQGNYTQDSYNQSINIDKQNNQQNVQMFSCPYCGGAIYQNQSPCPHCSSIINWQG